jgi:hypothetical protein
MEEVKLIVDERIDEKIRAEPWRQTIILSEKPIL